VVHLIFHHDHRLRQIRQRLPRLSSPIRLKAFRSSSRNENRTPPPQRILDIGAGTGLLGRPLIAAGSTVIECDPSQLLLQQCNGHKVAARAENLPFTDESFDAVTAAQCWHWFDRIIAPREIHRVLKPQGRIAIIYQTYLRLPGNIAAASEQIILRHRPRWRHAGGVGINGQALKDLQTARFTQIESFSFDVEIPYTRDAWQGFIRTCSPVGPSLSADELARFDIDHAAMLLSGQKISRFPTVSSQQSQPALEAL